MRRADRVPSIGFAGTGWTGAAKSGWAVAAAFVAAVGCSTAFAADKSGQVDIAKELECLALNIYWEAAFEPEAGKYGVAHVTLNRRDDKRWPSTVCEVVFEERAFSWTITHPDKKPGNNKAWRQAKLVANQVYFGLDKGKKLWRGVTYYHADYVREGIQIAWRYKLVEYVKVGKHIFYRPSYLNKKQKF